MTQRRGLLIGLKVVSVLAVAASGLAATFGYFSYMLYEGDEYKAPSELLALFWFAFLALIIAVPAAFSALMNRVKPALLFLAFTFTLLSVWGAIFVISLNENLV